MPASRKKGHAERSGEEVENQANDKFQDPTIRTERVSREEYEEEKKRG